MNTCDKIKYYVDLLLFYECTISALSTLFLMSFQADWLRDATLTALSPTSVNIEFVAGNDFHPSLWEVQREDWSTACSVSDRAPLRDCTDSRARFGRNSFRLGGRNGNTHWSPRSAHKNTLATGRT